MGFAVALAVAGCGRNDAANPPEPSPAVRRSAPPTPPMAAREALRIAVGSMVSPAQTYSAYEEMLALISEEIGLPFEFLQRRTYQEVNDLLIAGEVDLAFICSGAFAALPEDAGVEILVVPVVAGAPEYHSYLIARADSGIRDFEGLRGKRFAFTDALSNTGYAYPLSRLTDFGQRPSAFFASTMLTGSHDRSIDAVFRGRVDAAAVDSLIYDQLVVDGSAYEGQLVIFETSPAFPIPPVVAPAGLPDELKQRVRAALLGLHETQRGRDTLAKIGIDRFVAGDPDDYDVLRAVAYRARQAILP